ncbi:MAG TPA: hypothetical protein VEQ59_19045, partial [Polyangiaceae bacterium]|nr:hypothetical protein [Polyangiaceae bacterium]
MRKLTILLGLSAWISTATPSWAEDKAPAKAEAPAVSADGVRRDANGVKGLSPYMEALIKGDKAYVARDFDAA